MTRYLVIVVSLCWMMSEPAYSFAADTSDVFSALTRYVARQVETDKVIFVGAQRCTEWFYKQLKQKPPRSQTHTIAFTPVEAICASVHESGGSINKNARRFLQRTLAVP